VKVPEPEAGAALGDAERDALGARCQPCARTPAPSALPGHDPSSYPAKLCRGNACVETCGDAKGRLQALRVRFADTLTETHDELDRAVAQ
jgi:hypothetical protein